MRRAALASTLAAALAAALTGCGGDEGPEGPRRAGLVDPDGIPPLVSSLEKDPVDGRLLLATNTGLYSLAEGERRLRRVRARLVTGAGGVALGSGIVVRVLGPRRLLGSGHPDPGGNAPQYLGLMRSSDGGRTWRGVAYLGQRDYHAIEEVGSRLVLSDSITRRIEIATRDGGTIEASAAPGSLLDLAVDPRDAQRMVGASDGGLFLSSDRGRSWRPGEEAPNARLSWSPAGALFRADPGGFVKRSDDGGRTWDDAGQTAAREPQALLAVSDSELYVAGKDGSIEASTDAGRTWTTRFRP